MSNNVCVPSTRLANASVSVVSVRPYIDNPNITAICHGPMPPFEGMPIAMLDNTKHNNTTNMPWASSAAAVQSNAWNATYSCMK